MIRGIWQWKSRAEAGYPLAIFSPTIGFQSETFVRRHVRDLVPEGTVVITHAVAESDGGHWSVSCPVLVLDRGYNDGLTRQVMRGGGQRAELRGMDHRRIAKQFLKKYGVHVIMGEYLDASLPWIGLARNLGVRFFGHAHGYDVSKRLREEKWRTEYTRYNETSGVITMSLASRERLVALGLDPLKVHVVPYGVDVPNEPIKRVDGKGVRCITVGRMVAKKGPILTLDAFRRAAEALPTLRLDYVGSGVLLPAVQQFVRAFNLEDKVTLHGSQPNERVQKFMRDADIFLQHSMTDPVSGDEEGLPVAILEAMANGLSVVSTWHAGIPEAVADGLTGYLVDAGDSIGMAERLVALARDSDLRCRMGEAGWRRVKEHFSWERERASLLRILELPL